MLKYTVVIGKTEQFQGVAVDIDALEITLNKSEELDFGVFTIPATTRFENYQILDRVDITVTDGSNTKVYDPFVIISDKVEPVSKLGYYKHTVTFIESVHKFEKILSSNIYITQPLIGMKKTLLDVLQHIRNVIPFERTSFLSSTRLFDIDSNLATYLNGILAPQFFFNGGSLRDMLNGVASYVNAIARLEDNNNLIFSFYNEILSTIGIEDEVIYKTLSNQTDKWSSTIESKLENAVESDDTDKSIIVHPSPDAWVSLRSRTLKLTDDSYELRVPYPIERITKTLYRSYLELGYIEVTSLSELPGYAPNPLTAVLYKLTTTNKYYRWVPAQTPEEQDAFIEITPGVDFELISVTPFQNINNPGFAEIYYIFDVTSQVLILDQWKRLDLDRVNSILRNGNTLKINSLYYEIGGKVITNTQLGGIFNDITAFRAFHLRALTNAGFIISELEDVQLNFNKIPSNTIAVDVGDRLPRDFRIFYVPYFGSRIRSEKDNIIDHPYNTQTPINQAERIVSADRLLSNLYGLAQRTGQDEIQVKKYHTDLTEAFDLGDTTSDGFIVASIHYTYYIKYFVVNYQFTRNFNRFSNRIALSQENRPFDISLGSKTTNRNLIYTEYAELNTEALPNNSLVRRTGADVFANTVRTNKAAKNKSVHFGTIYDGSMIDVSQGDGVFIKTLPFGEGNTLNFYWGFDDIIGADDQLVLDAYFKNDGFLETNVNVNRFIRYTNPRGELDTFEMAFYHELDPSEYEANKYPIIKLPTEPLIGGHSSVEGTFDSFTVEKDKSESLSMNYQIAVVPHFNYVDKIFVGKEFITSNNLIVPSLTDTKTYKVWASTTEKYSNVDKDFVKGAEIGSASYTVSLEGSDDSTTSIKVSVTLPTPNSYKSWAIADTNGNLYLAANIDEEEIYNVYFNFRNRRTGMSYTFDGRDIQRSIPPFISLQSGLTSVSININDQQPSDFFEIRIKDLTNDGPYITATTTNTTFGFGDLTEVTEYEVGVRAVINGFVSPYTTRRIFTLGTPRKIENVYTTVEGNNIRVHWQPIPEAGAYEIQYRTTSQTWQQAVTAQQIVFSGTGTSSRLIENLQSNVIYVFRVRGFDLEFTGPFSDEVIGVITTQSDLVLTGIPSFDSIALNWTEVTGSSGYQIRFKEINQPTFPPALNIFDPSFTSFTLTGLSPLTTYDVGFRVVFTFEEDFRETIFTDWVDIRVTTIAVPPPGDLINPVITTNPGFPTTTQASWIITNNNDIEINLFYDTDNSPLSSTTTSRGTLAANASTTVTVSGTSGETRYIAAQFKQTNFNDSDVVTASQTLLVAQPMDAPSFITISDITSTSAKATWEFVSDATNGYLYRLRRTSDNLLIDESIKGQFVVVHTSENLTPDTSYYAQVQTRAVSPRPASTFTESNSFPTDPAPGVPAAPTSLQTTSVTQDGDLLVVGLTWIDNATNELGYRVYRRLGTAGVFTNVSGNLAANTVFYTDTAPAGGTIFYYVAAYNANGESLSNIISV